MYLPQPHNKRKEELFDITMKGSFREALFKWDYSGVNIQPFRFQMGAILKNEEFNLH
jgi:hypothetical protein